MGVLAMLDQCAGGNAMPRVRATWAITALLAVAGCTRNPDSTDSPDGDSGWGDASSVGDGVSDGAAGASGIEDATSGSDNDASRDSGFESGDAGDLAAACTPGGVAGASGPGETAFEASPS